MDVFDVDLYTWARMMAEYKGWGFGAWDRFREPDIEARDEGELREDLNIEIVTCGGSITVLFLQVVVVSQLRDIRCNM